MVRQSFLRMVSAAGFITLALFFVGIDPFFSASADVTASTSAISVNRALKGDRPPLRAPTVRDAPDWQGEFGALPQTQPRAEKPFACDPAFSPLAKAANVYRRCLA